MRGRVRDSVPAHDHVSPGSGSRGRFAGGSQQGGAGLLVFVLFYLPSFGSAQPSRSSHGGAVGCSHLLGFGSCAVGRCSSHGGVAPLLIVTELFLLHVACGSFRLFGSCSVLLLAGFTLWSVLCCTCPGPPRQGLDVYAGPR